MPAPRGILVTPVGFNDDGLPRGLSLLWGYTAVWAETVEMASAAAGDNELYPTPVPSGVVGVATFLSAWATATTVQDVVFSITDGMADYPIACETIDIANHPVSISGWIVVPPEWYPRALFRNCAGGEGLYFCVTGFYMEL